MRGERFSHYSGSLCKAFRCVSCSYLKARCCFSRLLFCRVRERGVQLKRDRCEETASKRYRTDCQIQTADRQLSRWIPEEDVKEQKKVSITSGGDGVGGLKGSGCPLHWQLFCSDLVSTGSSSRYPFPEFVSSLPTWFLLCPLYTQSCLKLMDLFYTRIHVSALYCCYGSKCKNQIWKQWECVLLAQCGYNFRFCFLIKGKKVQFHCNC